MLNKHAQQGSERVRTRLCCGLGRIPRPSGESAYRVRRPAAAVPNRRPGPPRRKAACVACMQCMHLSASPFDSSRRDTATLPGTWMMQFRHRMHRLEAGRGRREGPARTVQPLQGAVRTGRPAVSHARSRAARNRTEKPRRREFGGQLRRGLVSPCRGMTVTSQTLPNRHRRCEVPCPPLSATGDPGSRTITPARRCRSFCQAPSSCSRSRPEGPLMFDTADAAPAAWFVKQHRSGPEGRGVAGALMIVHD